MINPMYLLCLDQPMQKNSMHSSLLNNHIGTATNHYLMAKSFPLGNRNENRMFGMWEYEWK